MGVCSNKSEKAQMNLKEELQVQLLNIAHPLNVNHKYENYFTFLPNSYVGAGIKRTNQYISKLSRDGWDKLRKDFWEREKNSVQWQAIRNALAEENECIEMFVFRGGVIDPICLQFEDCWGFNLAWQKFSVPIFLINEPLFSDENSNCQTEQIKVLSIPMKVRIRSTKLPPDFEISAKSNSTVEKIKQSILEVVKERTCRLFVNGRELHDQQQLDSFGITSGTIIQAFL